jgi:predicted RNA polymerase sigma factor
VPEATMTRRITRAKTTVQDSGARFTMPADRDERLGAVLKVVYLIFNEGYTSTTGPSLQRVELAAEGIRLARMLHRLLPDDAEVAGLLALLLLTDARRPARTGPLGELVPMAEQDRSLWIPELIREGVELITATLPRGPVGPYQLQAAIAAVHDESPTAEETDWPQIAQLYGRLVCHVPSPVVQVNRAVAIGMADGPRAGLCVLDRLGADRRLAAYQPFHAARAELLRQAGDDAAAVAAYGRAIELSTNAVERAELQRRRAVLGAS